MSAIKERYPRVLSADSEYTSGQLIETSICSVTLQAGQSVVFVQVRAEVYLSGTAEAPYERLREAQRIDTEVTDVAGLGQGAYQFTSPRTGPHLVMYDGNLHLTVWGDSIPQGEDATDVRDVLPRIATATLPRLAG